MTTTSGAVRFARALVVAAVVVAMACGAHVLGGGALPAGIVVAALGALVLAGSVALTGRRVGRVVAVVALGVAQLALHAALSVFEGFGCTALVPTGAHAGMDHAAHAAYLATTGCAPAGGHATLMPMLGAWAMVVAHGLAVVACALVVAGTDRALEWLAAWLRPLVERLAGVTLPAWAELPVAVDHDSFERQTWRGVVPLRGPPAWQSPVPPAL